MRIWTTRTRIKVFGLTLFLIFFFSIFGFMLIKQNVEVVEGQTVNIIDALYWTVITLATLGYYPPGVGLTSHIGMAFTILVVLSGVVTIFLGAPSVVIPWAEERFRKLKDVKRTPIPTSGHMVVSGYGDTARYTLMELTSSGFQHIVITNDKASLEELESSNVPFIRGEGSDEKTLRLARIEYAAGLALVGRDEENIFACLTAKKMRPDISITALARNPETEKLLYKIGVNRVVTPKNAVGSMLAKRAVGRYDADLLEGKSLLGDMEMRQYTISSGNSLVGRTLSSSSLGKLTGIVLIGIWRDGDLDVSPSASTDFKEEDIIIVLGTPEQFNGLENLFIGVVGDHP